MININTKTRNLVVTAMLAAVSAILMFIEVPLPFLAPSFYKLDLSEVPVLIGSFALGPLSGVIIELIKILVKLVIKGTETAFVGEIANFVMGCSFILPAAFIYKYKKTKKNAILSMAISTVIMTVVSVILNAFILIPTYSKFYGIPIESIIEMGKNIFPIIDNVFNLCIICVAPFNIIKCLLVSVITAFIYKPLSKIIHQSKEN